MVSQQAKKHPPGSGNLTAGRPGRGTEPPGNPEQLPPALARLLRRHPSLRRQPHSLAVHFTIVYLLSATCFSLLYLLTRLPSLEATAYYCLAAGLLSTPFSMLTGHLSRWVNYPEAPRRIFWIEARLSWLLLVAGAAAWGWRTFNPAILTDFSEASCLYLILIVSLPVIVTVISFFGGLLTFPLEKD